MLDLGSGGGIDVLLSARRVGPTGKAYGLDMTDEMLALARENQRKPGLENVEFLKGQIEHIPLPGQLASTSSSPTASSTCRPTRTGCWPRRSASSSPAAVSPSRTSSCAARCPPAIRRSMELWVGCIAGALDETEYVEKLPGAGFVDVSIEPTRVYRAEDARAFLNTQGIDIDTIAPLVDNKFYSGFIRATKPAR